MNYLQTWVADHIAERIAIMRITQPSASALRNKRTAAGSYIGMRTAYGEKHHWPLDATGVDIDHYDHDPHTFYFLAHEKTHMQASLIGGLRLTQIHDFDAALSMAMWAHAVDKPHVVAQLIEHKHDIAHLQQAAHEGRLWDLTRLVTAMSLQAERTPKQKRATYVALLLMLGAAMQFVGNDAIWLFTTNPEVKRFLDRLGVSYTLLAHGRISYSDVGESYLGWVSVSSARQEVLHSKQDAIVRIAQRSFTHPVQVKSE